jgi:S-adenosylmethionine synthetase
MANKIIKITAHLPAIPDWLKINNSITIPLPIKTAKELAQKLLEVQDDAEIKISFASGKKTKVEIDWESEKSPD